MWPMVQGTMPFGSMGVEFERHRVQGMVTIHPRYKQPGRFRPGCFVFGPRPLDATKPIPILNMSTAPYRAEGSRPTARQMGAIETFLNCSHNED